MSDNQFVKVSGDAIIRRSEIVAVEYGTSRKWPNAVKDKGYQWMYFIWTRQGRKFFSGWTDEPLEHYAKRLLTGKPTGFWETIEGQ